MATPDLLAGVRGTLLLRGREREGRKEGPAPLRKFLDPPLVNAPPLAV